MAARLLRHPSSRCWINARSCANSLSEDTINGYGGDDYINAYQGPDFIDAGWGNDVIRGGRGWDEMIGGPGADEFRISTGDSGPNYNDADIIWDFMTGDTGDLISFDNNGLTAPEALVGTPGNYIEYAFQSDGTAEGAYNQALYYAQQDLATYDFAFYTDGVNGYLFADTNFNGLVDTGIEMVGLSSLDHFSWNDIQ
jgi:Ca2+-binding RTX toxin-like protein